VSDFRISRKTGYKILNRHKAAGLEALCDRLRRPVWYANQLRDQVERLIVDLKRDKPHWGGRKIRELLVRKLAGDVRLPAKSAAHAVRKQAAVVFERRLSEAARCQKAVCQMCMFCIADKRFSSN
jgi:hypothetical protein